jgi:hypothetical protein
MEPKSRRVQSLSNFAKLVKISVYVTFLMYVLWTWAPPQSMEFSWNSMEQSPSWEADSHSASQEIPRLYTFQRPCSGPNVAPKFTVLIQTSAEGRGVVYRNCCGIRNAHRHVFRIHAFYLPRTLVFFSTPSLHPAASYPMRTGGCLPTVKRPEREADHSLPCSGDAKNEWSYTSSPPIRLHGVALS